jgi:hypothetical protein
MEFSGEEEEMQEIEKQPLEVEKPKEDTDVLDSKGQEALVENTVVLDSSGHRLLVQETDVLDANGEGPLENNDQDPAGEPEMTMGQSKNVSPGDKSGEYFDAKSHETDDHSTETIDFLQDDLKDMTYGRRIALTLMKYAWYNPQVTEPTDQNAADEIIDGGRFRSEDGYPLTHSKKEQASLEKAWAYFDHVALPRYLFVPKENPDQKKSIFTRIINRFSKADKQLNRAEPGEADKPTRLYPPIFTPHKQLGDFGLGIGLYFATLRALTVVMFLTGIVHIPNFIYFSGPDYSASQTEVEDVLLKGSAICTEIQWVPCINCTRNDFDDRSFVRDYETDLTFAMRNLCDGATLETGMTNYTGLIFVILSSYLLSVYMRRMEVQYDEDEQTAQDYSIVITNPPEDAKDPQEWREFFRKAFDAQVTGCTVAVDNDLLVRTLVERREKMRMLELLVEPGTKLDIVTLAGIAAGVERERNLLQSIMASVSPGIPEIFGRMAVLTAKVQGLAQQDYPVTNVFITFETETDQRKVLEKLTVGQMAVDTNRTASVRDIRYLFRGFRVLSVHEPEEPDTIRWEDLNVTFGARIKQQFFTALATVATLIMVAFLVAFVNEKNYVLTSYTIAIFNALFPMFAKFLTYNEDHPSHGSLQTSLYYKIAVFRWVTTGTLYMSFAVGKHIELKA